MRSKRKSSARTRRCGRKLSSDESNVRTKWNCDADEKRKAASEEKRVEEEKKKEERENEGELHNEAKELESMLRSFETDLNCGEEGGE